MRDHKGGRAPGVHEAQGRASRPSAQRPPRHSADVPPVPNHPPRKNRTDRRAPRGIAPAHERKIAEKWASRWKIISRAGPRMEASQAAHGGASVPWRDLVHPLRFRHGRASQERSRRQPRTASPMASSCPMPRAACTEALMPVSSWPPRVQAESPAARSQSLPEEQKARSCAASASCRWGWGSFALRGGSAPAALAPFSPRYSMSMAREAVRASVSLVQGCWPSSWASYRPVQNRRSAGLTVPRLPDAYGV